VRARKQPREVEQPAALELSFSSTPRSEASTVAQNQTHTEREAGMDDVAQSTAENTPEPVRAIIDAVYRSESRRIFASLVRLLGDFGLAEEGLHDAFTAALEQWPRDGVPANPRAWLVATGRFKAIDRMRRRARFDTSLEGDPEQLQAAEVDLTYIDEQHLEDDRLRLIFTCCHPALPQEAQLALTLREVCGLTTEEIALGISLQRANDRQTDRAREGADPRCTHSL
jgi:DNA-directed RNA polymerase specialized sigma24 family protein